MRTPDLARRILLFGTLLLALPANGKAAEYAFSSYGLGEAAFSAGVTPPPGTYVTAATGFYTAEIGAQVPFGRVTINAGAKIDGFSNGWNVLYVPERKLFDGSIGLAVTLPVGHLDAVAEIGPFSREVSGWGFGDIVSRAQLGWQHGGFSHLLYVEAVAPTGKWEPGFSPIIGLHRPGIDTGWAFTWEHKPSKFQVNGSAGVTFNFENTATDYKTGDEFHFEWAIGQEVATGLVVGIVGYDYRQFTGDSGSGATLGPFKGSVDAIGAGVSYTTLIAKSPLIVNMRFYHEFDAENRWEGDAFIASATVRW